jgi:hypothetical protein
MIYRRVILALLVAGWLPSAGRAEDASAPSALPKQCTEKVAVMPDLCQTHKAFASLPQQGKFWCCPAAFANALIAMDGCGYESLFSGEVSSEEHQLALLAELGGKRYFRTAKEGTSPIRAMHGIRRFVQDRGYAVAIQWQGWRQGGEFSRGDRVDPRWLAEGVLGDSNVVLNVGWYKHDQAKELYSRIGGHYVTLAGYRNDGDETAYLIHDPSSRSGAGKVTHDVHLVPIPSGRLAPWKRYEGRSAVGYFFLQGIVAKRTADVAILDGAIRFAISKRE